MKALQAAVVLMGVVLVVGFVSLFVLWGRKTAGGPGAQAPPAPLPGTVAAEAVVAVPPGGRVVQVAPDGAFLDALVENPDGSRDLYHVRRADGAVVGTLRFRPAGP